MILANANRNPSEELAALERSGPLSRKLAFLHNELRQRFAFIERIAIAVYDGQTDVLKTFLASTIDDNPLMHYEARLAEVPSLRALAEAASVRVIDDLTLHAASEREHTQRLLAGGYRSSYTLPMYQDGEFFGFVFVDSKEVGSFDERVRAHVDPLLRLLSLVVIGELRAIRTLAAATRTARFFTSRRDSETGAHLERMARYSRLIAAALAPARELSDEYVEHVFLFAPLHDLGKIAIPDSILLSPRSLTRPEYELMKTHPMKGIEIVDYMLKEFGVARLSYVHVMRNIVMFHHEAYDGSGYPQGLAGEAIPLEARITAVADVFDALTSRRPYKEAWSIDRALDEMRGLAGARLDPACVETLAMHRPDVEAIGRQFRDSPYG